MILYGIFCFRFSKKILSGFRASEIKGPNVAKKDQKPICLICMHCFLRCMHVENACINVAIGMFYTVVTMWPTLKLLNFYSISYLKEFYSLESLMKLSTYFLSNRIDKQSIYIIAIPMIQYSGNSRNNFIQCKIIRMMLNLNNNKGLV